LKPGNVGLRRYAGSFSDRENPVIKIYTSVIVMFTALAAFVCAEDVLIPRQQLIKESSRTTWGNCFD
jgi:hypothetical protein